MSELSLDRNFERLFAETPEYRVVYNRARPYYAQGRWWDVFHLDQVTHDMRAILEGEGQVARMPVLLPAAMLHDVGWSAVGDEKNSQWDAAGLRIKHMEIGAGISKEMLTVLGWNPLQIDEIAGLVAVHDNQYLGIEPQTPDEQILRDADASFILSYESFWKDIHAKGENTAPKDFLEKQASMYGKRFTRTAQQIVDQQVIDRTREVRQTSISPAEHYQRIFDVAQQRIALFSQK